MPLAALLHWKPEEAAPVVEELRRGGFEVEVREHPKPLAALRPCALVIDLSRMPSNGKAVAEQWRLRKATRLIPIVFVGGAPDKVAGVRSMFPDAVYAAAGGLAQAVRRAIREAPEEPVVHRSMSAYAGTPLVKKLGLKEGTTAILLDAPQGFERKLQPLPAGLRLASRGGAAHRVLLFAASAAALERGFRGAAGAVGEGGGLWILYPKQSSGIESDLTQAAVRAFALERGWVDYKVCAADETWTGLLFARAKRH